MNNTETDRLLLPLVESLIRSQPKILLSRVRIIGVQHLLETTHAMFQALYQLGLKPENISIIGKCYSTCPDVYKEMVADGISVSPKSLIYTSHTPFDEFFSKAVQEFIITESQNLSAKDFDCLILLDDGGKCISYFSDNSKHIIPIVAIEQTSSGYHAIRNKTLDFPVINVARSPTKLTLEAPMIAQAAAERLYRSLKLRNLSFKKALLIGNGAIGKAVKALVSKDMEIVTYDRDRTYCDKTVSELPLILPDFPLIIGCTGETSIPHTLHSCLAPGTVLVSMSSSDREFDAYYLRKQITETNTCFSDLEIAGILLINNGFPVNFDGDRENIDLELIQLTIALITAGILQAHNIYSLGKTGIINLDKTTEKFIKQEFLSIKNIKFAKKTYSKLSM